MRAWLTEFIGTFFLVLTIGMCATRGVSVGPLAIGSILMTMVYMGGPISGAHYNPAVSLAVMLRGKLSLIGFVSYVVAQCLGAIVAALAVYGATHHTFAPEPGESASAGGVLLIEFLYTFALALVVLNVTTSAKSAGNSYFGLAIGFTVAAGAFAVGGLSGGAFNPAVGFGPILVNYVVGSGTMAHLWLYLVGPLAGGALAAPVFLFQESR